MASGYVEPDTVDIYAVRLVTTSHEASRTDFCRIHPDGRVRSRQRGQIALTKLSCSMLTGYIGQGEIITKADDAPEDAKSSPLEGTSDEPVSCWNPRRTIVDADSNHNIGNYAHTRDLCLASAHDGGH